MGSLYDNGGTHPPEGGGSPDGLPDLPPEWGTVIIPDDAAALADEAALVRRELRQRQRRHRLLRLVPGARDGAGGPSLGIPLLIMVVAMVATVSSLFVVAWPSALVRRTPPAPAEPRAEPTAVPDVRLTDRAGGTVQLRDSLPAVVLLVDGCDCGGLVHATTTAAPPRVSVLVVGRYVPDVAPVDASRVRALGDPQTTLARLFAGWPGGPGTATVLLVRSDGSVPKVIPGASSAQDFLPALRGLN
jgi:hypothetical protein